MAARGNEVALAIEGQIREAIEKMVGDIRSSIDDVRDAVNQQLQAALQSVQADANAISLRSSLEKTLNEFEGTLGDAPAATAEPVHVPAPRGEESSRIKRAVQGVERGKTQVEVLNALLDQGLEFSSRVALLILKGDSFAGWKGLGFARFGGNDDQVKRFTATPGMVAELDELVRTETVVSFDGASIAGKLGVGAPSRALLVPMVIKDKIAAAVYVDQMDGDEEKLDRSSVELLVFTTGLLIDTLAIRKKTPSPSLSDDAGTPPAPRPAAAPAPAPAAPSTPPPTMNGTIAVPSAARDLDLSMPRAPQRPAPEPTFATTAMPALRLENEAAPAAAAPAPPPVAPVQPPKPAAPAAGAGGFGEGEGRPTTQYVPPPGVTGARFGAQPQSEDAKKHDEARRFARLLVSEIKLYNESKVEQGRKNRDLYERLKEDIDRSRQMYDERIGEDVRKASNYFYDELVRILADGDADALGL